jgi:ribosomal protein L37E
VGNTFTKLELYHAVPGVAQADRRMRDLRPIQWIIDNYKVNPSLKPDEYLLRAIGARIDLGEPMPKNVRKTITGPKRRRIFERDGHTCQVCGIPAGEVFPDAPSRTAIMTIGHIVPNSRGGSDADDNLRTECQRCGDESRDITADPPSKGEVLNRAQTVGGIREKRRLFGWMEAGRRTPEDIEKVFVDWLRLPTSERAEVMSALAVQIFKEIDPED